jgi:7-cyano-7-deazaguanine reductase
MPTIIDGRVVEPTPVSEMHLHPLESFPYDAPGKRLEISFTCPEFTAICPFSSFPDFATIKILYVPDKRCVELKALKLHLNSFRQVKIFHEHVVNFIRDELVELLDPLELEVIGDFNVRGNIKTVIKAPYTRH